ncbi:MAG: histone-like protein [Candidatus Micrarchaeaceae archaeon]
MPKISASSIKKLVRDSSGTVISDSAANAISKILEKKAKRIARYAVKRAKSKKRATILEEDIDTYRLKFGD